MGAWSMPEIDRKIEALQRIPSHILLCQKGSTDPTVAWTRIQRSSMCILIWGSGYTVIEARVVRERVA